MLEFTENLNLKMTNMEADGEEVFDFDTDLNQNWNKIDKFSKHINYVKGCVNSGPIDANGEPAILTYDETTRTITVNAPFVYTTYSGKTYECSDNLSAVIDENMTGTVRFWVDKNTDGAFFVEPVTNNIFIQKSEPQNAVENDVWVDISIAPEVEKRKTANGWQIYDGVEIGSLTGFQSGGGGSLMLNPYNVSDIKSLNHSQLSNCVLSAPNGVASYEGSTITVKAGLKVLIPYGRNADYTLNNIEYTLPANISVKMPTARAERYCLFIDNNGNAIGDWTFSGYYISFNEPKVFVNNSAIWFDTLNNYIKTTTNGGRTWTNVFCAFISGVAMVPGTATVSGLKPHLPIRVLTKSDDMEISGYSMPNSTEAKIELTLGASGETIEAPANGYLCFAKGSRDGEYVQLNGTVVSLKNKNNLIVGGGNAAGVAYACMPMQKGQQANVYYTASGAVLAYRFVYCAGEV